MIQPRTKALSLDEQMVPFSERVKFRQYFPSKPNPVRLKSSVLAPGKEIHFHVYQGKTTLEENICQPKCGVGARAVLNLQKGLEPGHVLYVP